MKTVLTFGTFDLFHPGHTYYLSEAKKLGDKLIVITALDETVKQVKGFYPSENQETRQKKIQETNLADLVILGNPNNKYQVLLDHKPDIIALGYDQTHFTKNLNQVIIDLGLNSQIIRIDSHKPDQFKSSYFKQKQ